MSDIFKNNNEKIMCNGAMYEIEHVNMDTALVCELYQ